MSIYFYKNYFDFCRSVCFVGFESNKNIGRSCGAAPVNVLVLFIGFFVF